jgi:FkbM family methyltransferase
MNKIFLDCGTHLCEGIVEFYNKGIIDETFEIHTFEANPACNIIERVKQIPLNIIPYNKAVWVEDGFVYFNQENHKKSKLGSPNDGYSDIDGWASSVDGIGFNYPGYEEKIKIPSINFSKFIKNIPNDYFVVCKMDIEGSEFTVLRHLIKEKTICKINKIFIEFHERFMPNESIESKNSLIKEIEELGVEVYSWT